MIKWCKKCILPDSRPNIFIHQNGVCNACKNHKFKKNINWSKRKKKLIELFKKSKTNNNPYDCLIPVSGGKDSTWQVLTCLNYGLNHLQLLIKAQDEIN